ncbi:MAG: amidohydrolase family protein [Candidatus Tectomicrobia bacterium]|nr:amidohydrolase family protein [Candidatus Tectomicrobia bacterium]
MSNVDLGPVDENNQWRLDTPGADGWAKSVWPDATNKYTMISCDSHATEPATLLFERVDKKFHDRLAHVRVDEDGSKWHIVEGMEPARWVMDNEDLEGEDRERNAVDGAIETRLAHQDRDGVDGEIIFPNKFLTIFATSDPEFAFAQTRAYNDWAWEFYGPLVNRLSPMAVLPTMDVDLAIEEAERVARMGYRGVTIPVKPVYGSTSAKDPHYNRPEYDRLWACLEGAALPATIHVGTGKDPRTTRGYGGAVTNYVAHALSPSVEVMSILCSSGVLERHPGLRIVSVESGVGWFPWCGQAMDEAYRKHHMWSFPKMKELPSHYLKTQCFGTFMEDPVGLSLAEEFGYQDAMLWSSDYPHQEGSWPHSAEAIERQMGGLSEESRVKILGGNAAKLFGFNV